MSSKTLYYPVWISPGRRAGGWSWGAPCDTAEEAGRIMAEHVLAGAPLGTVVEFSGGARTPLVEQVNPPEARKPIRHWERLWDETEATDG